MDWIGIIFAVIIGVFVGGVAITVGNRARLERLSAAEAERQAAEARAQKAEVDLATANGRLENLNKAEEEIQNKERRIQDLVSEVTGFQVRLKELETQMEAERRSFEERTRQLDEAEQKLKDAFNALSSDALRKNNAAFLELAQETFDKLKKQSEGDLEKRQIAIQEMVKPIEKSLTEMAERVISLDKTGEGIKEQIVGLGDQQRRLQETTQTLNRALKNSSQRGRWGEIQLENVVKMAGMLEYCDFEKQESRDSEEGRKRPDLTVRLPNDQRIVVDSKVPLEAYLEAIESTDDETRQKRLKDHADHVRSHLKALSQKSYWDTFGGRAELVVMFLPGEPMFNAALEHDPSLIEFGVNNRVLIATPTTLIGLLRAIAYGWRQEKLAEDAQKIADLGKDLYGRIATMSAHFGKVGKNLDQAVDSYNKAVGSFESRVLPAARRFKDLGAAATEEIGQLEQLEKQTRTLQSPDVAELPPETGTGDKTLF